MSQRLLGSANWPASIRPVEREPSGPALREHTPDSTRLQKSSPSARKRPRTRRSPATSASAETDGSASCTKSNAPNLLGGLA